MDMNDIRAAVLTGLKTVAPELAPRTIRAERPLRTQLDLDSMDWLNVIAGPHELLGVVIPETDHGRLTRLDEIVALLGARLTRAHQE